MPATEQNETPQPGRGKRQSRQINSKHTYPKPGEGWKAFANRLADMLDKDRKPFTLRRIAGEVQRHFGMKVTPQRVLYWTNPEYRRDQIMYRRKLRASMTRQDHEDRSFVRRMKAKVKFRIGTPEQLEHLRRAREKRWPKKGDKS